MPAQRESDALRTTHPAFQHQADTDTQSTARAAFMPWTVSGSTHATFTYNGQQWTPVADAAHRERINQSYAELNRMMDLWLNPSTRRSRIRAGTELEI